MHFLLLAALLLHIPAHADTQTRVSSPRLQEESLQSAALGRAMKYRVLLPVDYATSLASTGRSTRVTDGRSRASRWADTGR